MAKSKTETQNYKISTCQRRRAVPSTLSRSSLSLSLSLSVCVCVCVCVVNDSLHMEY